MVDLIEIAKDLAQKNTIRDSMKKEKTKADTDAEREFKTLFKQEFGFAPKTHKMDSVVRFIKKYRVFLYLKEAMTDHDFDG